MSETITVNQAGSAVNVTGVEIEKGTKGGEYILLTVPGLIGFHKAVQDAVISDFRELGGQWLGMSSKWRFSADKEMSVRRLCTSLFGWHCWKDNGLSPAVQALMSKESGESEAPSPQPFVLGCGSISPYNGVAVTLEYSKRPGKDRIVVNVSEKDIESEDDGDAESRVENFCQDAELLGGRFNAKYGSWSFLPVQQSLVEKLLFDWFGPGEDGGSAL